MIYRIGGDTVRNMTQTAGTKIQAVCQPHPNGVTVLTQYVYTTAGTGHAVTVMREIGRTYLTASAAAAATSLSVAGDPGPSGNLLAANDYVVIMEADNVARIYKVSSFSGTTLVLTSGLVAGANVGAAVWDLGVESDTYPPSGAAHNAETIASGSTNFTRSNQAGMESGRGVFSPVVLSSNNLTNAGTLNQLDWMHLPVAG